MHNEGHKVYNIVYVLRLLTMNIQELYIEKYMYPMSCSKTRGRSRQMTLDWMMTDDYESRRGPTTRGEVTPYIRTCLGSREPEEEKMQCSARVRLGIVRIMLSVVGAI